MSGANRRAAAGALDRVRPLVEGLHRNRPSADLAADIGAAWEATEVVLRALLGGSALSGPALVKEVRQRELLSLDQAHSLVNFHAARARAELPGYVVEAADVDAARAAVAELDGSIAGTTRPDTGTYSSPTATPSPGADTPVPVPVAPATRTARSRSAILIVAVVALLAVVIPLGAWWAFANRVGGPRSMAAATELYSRGDREGARAAFARIAGDKPELPLPHVFLARIAREQGDVQLARQELETAIRLDPDGAVALREMGGLMLATDNPELARRFYMRAVELDPSDRASQGYLGCALLRLGQLEVGRRFLDRAGPGDWSACTALPPMPPPPGM